MCAPQAAAPPAAGAGFGAASGFGGGGGAAMTTQPAANANAPDVEIAQPDGYLKDCVSGLAWRPGNSAPGHLSATLWDGDVRCFEVDAQGKCVPKLQTQAGSPVLGHCWTGVRIHDTIASAHRMRDSI